MGNTTTEIDIIESSDYYFICEEIGNLVNCTSETDIEKKVFELLDKLISPRQIVLIDYSRDKKGKATYFNRFETENLEKDAYDSFTIEIEHRKILQGVFEFYGVGSPENIEVYKRRGAVLCSIYRAAIANARKFKIIENQKEQLKNLSDHLTEMIHSKDKLFSIIAHDLRGTLSSLMGLTTILADEFSALSLQNIMLMTSKMKNSSISLFGLLENLLEWARSQQGLIVLKPERLDVSSVAKDCVKLLDETVIKKNIHIKYVIPKDLKVYADLETVQSILRNLVYNGLKFTRKGGEIEISAEKRSDGDVRISIRDSGIGIPDVMLNSLFSVKVKSNRKGTDGELSSGLGLILCKDLVEKNGGRIWVESEEGKGATFSFTLPTRKQVVPIEN